MLSPVILALAPLYIFLGVVIVRKLRKPTCRVCALREFCPNRESDHSDKTSQPCWSCGQTGPCAASTRDAK
jgi:hypothetical protein